MSLSEVARYLSVSAAVVDRLVAEKALRVLRIGSERRVRPEDLNAFLRAAEE